MKKKGVRVSCRSCGRVWHYKGSRKKGSGAYISCPNCHFSNRI